MIEERRLDALDDAATRIERCARVLKHGLHLRAKIFRVIAAQRGQRLAVITHIAGGGWKQAEQDASKRGLARPRLADERNGFARLNCNRNIVHRAQVCVAAKQSQSHAKIFDEMLTFKH